MGSVLLPSLRRTGHRRSIARHTAFLCPPTNLIWLNVTHHGAHLPVEVSFPVAAESPAPEAASGASRSGVYTRLSSERGLLRLDAGDSARQPMVFGVSK